MNRCCVASSLKLPWDDSCCVGITQKKKPVQRRRMVSRQPARMSLMEVSTSRCFQERSTVDVGGRFGYLGHSREMTGTGRYRFPCLRQARQIRSRRVTGLRLYLSVVFAGEICGLWRV